MIRCLNEVFGQILGHLRRYEGSEGSTRVLAVSCIVSVSVPTLCWCMRWPDYGGFLADGYLWASPREFPGIGVAKTVLEMPQNRGRGSRTEKEEGHFRPFLEENFFIH